MATRAIVVAADNPATARLIQDALNEVQGYGAVIVDHGSAALDVIAQVQADLAILDLDLPGLGGLMVGDLLRGQIGTVAVPILFLTTREGERELQRRGLRDYLHKPVDTDALLARVRDLFAQDPIRA
jgi:DNA-binding response OmpR family regulator